MKVKPRFWDTGHADIVSMSETSSPLPSMHTYVYSVAIANMIFRHEEFLLSGSVASKEEGKGEDLMLESGGGIGGIEFT